ncbi:MAG TPA: MFS transporter, partial [Thermodesulfobacteriota bacterium]
MNNNASVIAGRKEIFGWGMYDFANSAFATTISSVVFSVYFTQVVVGEGGAEIFGHKIPASSLWGYTVSLSTILVVFTAPILGAIADFAGTKKKFLFLYCYVGCLFTGLLFFAKEGDYIFAMIFYMLANYFFAGSLGFYNAFLPEISTKENIGRISGFGWALGFVGGGILLAINLVMIRYPGILGIPDKDHLPVRFVILSVAIWWAIFAVFTFLLVRERAKGERLPAGENYVSMGFKRVILTLKKIRQHK